VGVVLAALLFIKRVSETSEVTLVDIKKRRRAASTPSTAR
jgi:hypothetical protein